MKILYLFLTVLSIPLTQARPYGGAAPDVASHPEFKLGISDEEKKGWLNLTIFFKKKAFRIYMNPDAKLNNIVTYIASQTGHSSSNLELRISEMKETDTATRNRRTRHSQRALSAGELSQTAASFGRRIFQIKKRN